MRVIILLIFLTSYNFAFSVNESLLKIHATLVPKIYLMDYSFKEKLHDNSIKIVLLYDRNDYKNALLLKEQIETKYSKKIENYNIKTILRPYEKVTKIDANIYYIFPTSKKNIANTINTAKRNHALTFSYSSNDLKNGVMLSLKIGSKVKPIINLSAVKSNNVIFRPVLLKISHIYTKDAKSSFLDTHKQNMCYICKRESNS